MRHSKFTLLSVAIVLLGASDLPQPPEKGFELRKVNSLALPRDKAVTVESGLPIPAGTVAWVRMNPKDSNAAEVRPVDHPSNAYLVNPRAVEPAPSSTSLNPTITFRPLAAALGSGHGTGDCTSTNFALPSVPVFTPPEPPAPPEPPPVRAPAAVAATNLPAAATRTPAVAAGTADFNVPPSVNGGTTAQANSNLIDTFSSAADIANDTAGTELVEAGIAAYQANEQKAGRDYQTVAEPYRELPTQALAPYLSRAQKALSSAADLLQNAQSTSLDPSEAARFRNIFLNARDKAQLGLDALNQQPTHKPTLGDQTPFQGILPPQNNEEPSAVLGPLARSAALANIFGDRPGRAPSQAATSADALTNRLVMFNGLPAQERARLLPQLSLVERPKVIAANGKTHSPVLLHNGYVLGGSATSMDCSSFVSSILPADLRKGRFTTLDYKMMWTYRRTMNFKRPPIYTPEREKLVKEVAQGFYALDVYAGDDLAPGDLLVYRVLTEPIGHIFLIRSYNPRMLHAEVIEAAQSAGGIRERGFSLSADPVDARERYLRPGLYLLRLKPTSNRACAYKDHGVAHK